jgi:putative membrane protein
MMWGYADGWSWLWMTAMMVLFWGGIVALAVLAFRSFGRSKSDDHAMDTLRRRFASGEITQDEFEKTRKALQA